MLSCAKTSSSRSAPQSLWAIHVPHSFFFLLWCFRFKTFTCQMGMRFRSFLSCLLRKRLLWITFTVITGCSFWSSAAGSHGLKWPPILFVPFSELHSYPIWMKGQIDIVIPQFWHWSQYAHSFNCSNCPFGNRGIEMTGMRPKHLCGDWRMKKPADSPANPEGSDLIPA